MRHVHTLQDLDKSRFSAFFIDRLWKQAIKIHFFLKWDAQQNRITSDRDRASFLNLACFLPTFYVCFAGKRDYLISWLGWAFWLLLWKLHVLDQIRKNRLNLGFSHRSYITCRCP